MEEIIKGIVEQNGCQLYDIELIEESKGKVYRIYITKPTGVTLGDCIRINRLISPILDVNSPIEGRYFLEVSSPGLERKLKKERHFQMSIGEQVKIVQFSGKWVKGQLKDVADGKIVVATQKGDIEIKLSDIKTAKTYIDWDGYLKEK